MGIFTTSGTSGRKLKRVVSWRDWRLMIGMLHRNPAPPPGEIFMLLGPVDGLLGPSVGVEAARLRGSIPVLAGMWDTRTKVQAIAELRPGVIAGAASYIVHLSEVAAEMGVDLSACGLRAVTSFGEPGAAIDATHATIEQRFGVEQIVDGYGLTEVWPLGGNCPQSRALHIPEDIVAVECIDPDSGAPVAEGEPGEIVLTTLVGDTHPLLRYRTRDVGRLVVGEPCACGSTFARIERIEGRTDDMIWYRGANFFPSAVEEIVRRQEGLSPEYRIVLDDGPRGLPVVTIQVEGDAQVHARVRASLRGGLGRQSRGRGAGARHPAARRAGQGQAGARPKESRDMKAGRFVVDTHVHAQRFAAGKGISERPPETTGGSQWGTLGKTMSGLEPYDNTPRLEYDMACYGVDMCVLLPAFGMTDELNLEMVERSPDKYVAACGCTDYIRRCREGEEEWSIDGVCAELDRLLGTGRFVAIGESLPYMPSPWDQTALVSRVDAIANILKIVEVAQQHGVAARIHTGIPYGYTAAYSYGYIGPANVNPLWMLDIAAAFPDVDADLRPRRHPGRLVGALLRGVPDRHRRQRQRLRRDRAVVARALREADDGPQHRPLEAAVGHRLGREHADLLPARALPAELRGPAARRGHPPLPGRLLGLEPARADLGADVPGRHEPDPGRQRRAHLRPRRPVHAAVQAAVAIRSGASASAPWRSGVDGRRRLLLGLLPAGGGRARARRAR